VERALRRERLPERGWASNEQTNKQTNAETNPTKECDLYLPLADTSTGIIVCRECGTIQTNRRGFMYEFGSRLSIWLFVFFECFVDVITCVSIRPRAPPPRQRPDTFRAKLTKRPVTKAR
jgi:hypothetical protein